jgi:hypothetical protein
MLLLNSYEIRRSQRRRELLPQLTGEFPFSASERLFVPLRTFANITATHNRKDT